MVTLTEPNVDEAVLVRRLPDHDKALGKAKAHFRRGNTMVDEGDLAGALREFDDALRLVPDDPTFRNNRGAVLEYLGKHRRALGEFDRVLEAQPADPVALHNRGVALAQLHRWRDAAEAYERALVVQPKDAGTLANLALALVRLDRLEDAVAALDRALNLEPNDPETVSLRKQVVAELLRRLARKRVISWGGGKPKGSEPPVAVTPGPPISDYVIEDRR